MRGSMHSPIEVTLEHSLYPREAIATGIVAFSEACTFTQQDTINASHLTIHPQSSAPAETLNEFLSYVLSASIEMHLRGQ